MKRLFLFGFIIIVFAIILLFSNFSEKSKVNDSTGHFPKEQFKNHDVLKTNSELNSNNSKAEAIDDTLEQKAIIEELQINDWSEEHIKVLRERTSKAEEEFFKNSTQFDTKQQESLKKEADRVEEELIKNKILDDK